MKHRPRGQSRILRFIRQLTFVPHDPVLVTGIYRVMHKEHRLAPEVTLLQGNEFPACAQCEKEVFFQFLRSAKLAPGFEIVLCSLPEIKNGGEETLTGSEAA